MSGGRRAVVLVSHGTVDALDDLAAFVTNVRRGRPPEPEVVAELRRRYEAIGGKSPLNAINAALAGKLEAALGVPVRLANRLWKPYARDVLAELARDGFGHVALVPLAQHSAHVYASDAKSGAAATNLTLACAPSWGQTPALHEAFARRIRHALDGVDPSSAIVLMTAHSLPRAVIEQGDPYEHDVRTAAAAIAQRIAPVPWTIVFQSQGMGSNPGDWLGPDLPTALDEAKARGARDVVLAPIGFLADHIEILYDLDIEATDLARARGLRTVRAPSLNADDDVVAVIAQVARGLLALVPVERGAGEPGSGHA